MLIQSVPSGNGEPVVSFLPGSARQVEEVSTPVAPLPPALSPLLHSISSTAQMSPTGELLEDQEASGEVLVDAVFDGLALAAVDQQIGAVMDEDHGGQSCCQQAGPPEP